LFRTGLAHFLGEQLDMEVVGQASNGRMGVQLATELAPDVVLMDLRLPDIDGMTATREILRARPQTRVVALTVATSDVDIASALNAGACAFLVKDSPIQDVASAVRAAASGSAWLSARAAEAVLGRIREPTTDGPDASALEQLTERELDVLRLIARGFENAQIAETLAISPSTAKNHVSSILGKLGLPNRIQAAIYAIRNELV
jgi:NarL family two-component system response regulator LiaR